MTYDVERFNELRGDVLDCKNTVRVDEEALRDAQKWFDESVVNHAKAIIALDEFKKENGI